MFRYAVLGQDAGGKIIERWHLRHWYLVVIAQREMQLDPAIVKITVVNRCYYCGDAFVDRRCLNPDCKRNQVALPAPEVVADAV